MTRVAVVVLLGIVGCGSSRDPEPEPAPRREPPPVAAIADKAIDFDFRKMALAEVVIELAANAPASRTLALSRPGRIAITTTHVRGQAGRLTIDVHTTSKDVPSSSDAMTCAECSLRSEVDLATPTALVKLTSDTPMSIRLRINPLDPEPSSSRP